MKLFLALFIILHSLLSLSVMAEDISEMILPNGLKIVVKPDHRSPIAVFQIWYKVGSSYEVNGQTGLSHMLEHLMFAANNNDFLSQGFDHLNKVGAKGGAYTGRDDTFYHHILAKEYLSLAFSIEAERMQYLSPSMNEFIIEKKVIKEELHTSVSKEPYLLAHNILYKKAYQGDSYQFPVIGRLNDLNALTLEEAVSWHKKYYAPDNATIVVVGDVDALEVFKLTVNYFGTIKKSKHLPAESTLKIKNAQSKVRYVMTEKNKVGAVIVAFKVPSIKTSKPYWEAYALDVLAGWFETGTISRLTKALIRDRPLAFEITVSYAPMQRKDSLFIIEAIPAQGVSIKELEKSLLAEIAKIKQEIISQKTLHKIKNQMIATEIFDKDSLYIQAKIIGQSESINVPWSEDIQYISRIKAVTGVQLKQVLDKYFVPSKQTIIIQNTYNEKQ